MIFHKASLKLINTQGKVIGWTWHCKKCDRKATQRHHPSLYFYTYDECLDCCVEVTA